MLKWASKIFGDSNERELKQFRGAVEEVNALEAVIEGLTDDELCGKTDEFRSQLADGEALDDLLPEAFAVAREQIRRSRGERAHDVQIIGASVLHHGKIAEMKTGEGKTLVATLALYLNGLDGQGAHLITVNDYLAKRDSQWYGKTLQTLGLKIGVLQHDSAYLLAEEQVSDTPNMEYLEPCTRTEAYKADVTYGTNHEFGFDFLRDNMGVDVKARVQRERHFAIVDEVDNILIDEARTPLIISG
ncbi:MAG: preprotein translocase subunit SecA, partial [Chloroflexi bacterium]|nr:preprotein translocase subunit SecA [Chloroflexota bacterium]